MAHFNFVISQSAKWGHAGFYIDCHRMTVPENILLQKSTAFVTVDKSTNKTSNANPTTIRHRGNLLFYQFYQSLL